MLPIALIGLFLVQVPASDQPLAKDIIARISPDRCKATVEKLASFGTRHVLSDTVSDTRGVGAARRWLKSELESYNGEGGGGGRLEVKFEEFQAPRMPRLPDGGTLVNVVAVLPGTMPQAAARRYYVVGHYDSINGDKMDPTGDAPGANDDASGVAVVLECARVLAREKLEATVVFLCTAGEEQGLVGAKYHADQAATRGEKIVGVLNNDIVGDPSPLYLWNEPMTVGAIHQGGRSHVIRVFSEGLPRSASAEQLAAIRNNAAESDSVSRQLARFVSYVAGREDTAIKPLLVFRQDRFLRGGDHSAFNEAGFAAVRFTAPGEDYTRQHANVTEKDGKPYGDVPTFVEGDYLGNVVRLNTAVLMHLSNAPSAPAHARIITKELTTNTALAWDASPEPDVAGYEVMLRDTTSPEWGQAVDVGSTTAWHTAVSKDNVFFGVRAYDKAGYRSPVSFCWAAKE
jgi:Zn-dependent M28 family amino/carboxypeptidase